VLAVAVLKGIDPLALKGSQEPSSSAPLATDWNNAALIFTFCEVFPLAAVFLCLPL
jgi:hypothetical protein